ncbi:MAG TPA: hypothetical protein VK082_03985 [Paenalcaligenes sp.]|nr:hypothetical protein [Paenalcaligenes sp.]
MARKRRRRGRRQQLEIEPLNWVAPEDREAMIAEDKAARDEHEEQAEKVVDK